MSEAPASLVCAHCRAEGTLSPLSERIWRCLKCGFIVPSAAAARDTSSVVPNPPSVAPNGVFRGKYRLIKHLGNGSHGATYLARHEDLNLLCVVKFLSSHTSVLPDPCSNRLRNDARTVFRVQDPNVVRVLDCDTIGGAWFFVSEFVDGVNLSSVLDLKQRVCWTQAVQIASDAAQGLAAIHRARLLHGDIKPANLLLGCDGRARITDLGVAALSPSQVDAPAPLGPLTVSRLGYTAPEVFRTDAAIGPPADLYSLGATLFHLLTGRPIHAGTLLFQRLIDTQCRPVRWPDDPQLDVPAWLVDLVLKSLAIEPTQRFRSADEFIEQLATLSKEPVARRTTLAVDTLQPRGVGVLPLENEQPTPDDDWLGYAVANYLSRALSVLPDVYVSDQDALVSMVERLASERGERTGATILAAGRMVGAATVITGRFARTGASVRIFAQALRAGGEVGEAVARVAGPLADLANLERALFERLARVLGLSRTVVDYPRAVALGAREKFVLGKQAFLRGDYESAIRLGEEALAIDADFAEAIGFVGVCLARLGRYDEAEQRHRQQEALAKRTGDTRREIEALANLGVMDYFRGHYDAAETHFTRAARAAAELESAAESAQISNNLGFVYFRQGRAADAEQAFLRAIDTHRAYGGLTSLVGPYNGLGNVLVEQGRFEEARAYYQRALALAVEIGDRTVVGMTHLHLGRCAALEQCFADAKHEFTIALNALEETRFWNGLARAYEYIAEMHLQRGDYEESARCADKRVQLARLHSNVRMESAAWQQKAESLRRAGRTEEAEACINAARAADGRSSGTA